MELVVATGNAGKLREIRRRLEGIDIEVLGMDVFVDLPEVIEDGDTFAENAAKKAQTIAAATGRMTLADDSGLEVAVLDGRPGVHSARYAGEDADDAANNAKLLRELSAVPPERRQGAFVCVMALCLPEGECRYFSGRLEGEILSSPRGDGGFGYDPLFWLADKQKSLAEIPLDEKNGISHRGQALDQVVKVLQGD
ncbi:MAG: non-canonical purine NTP pyrophosphatase [Desulfuromonas sp.]|nr:MAG: non-canonical purine NTP pyrophosphatase [Desulfuromonas sp.]